MKKVTKVVSAVLGIGVGVMIVDVLINKHLDGIDDWDEEETLSDYDEAYDRGYSHGIRGLPYAGKNPAASTFQDIAVAETMATYGQIVEEMLRSDEDEV